MATVTPGTQGLRVGRGRAFDIVSVRTAQTRPVRYIGGPCWNARLERSMTHRPDSVFPARAAGALPAHRRRSLRRLSRERGRGVRLRHPRRGDAGHQRGARPLAAHHLRAHEARAGRRLHGRRLRPAHRQARRVPRDSGSRGQQPGHRHRRRDPRPRAAGCAHRSDGPRRHAQGHHAPVHRHGRDAAAHDQVEHAPASPAHGGGGGAQSVQHRRPPRSPARPTWSCPRTSWSRRPSARRSRGVRRP